MPTEHATSASASETAQAALKGLLLAQLGRIQDGETHLAEEVPRFVETSERPALKSLLVDWLAEIQEDGSRLKEIAKLLGVPEFAGTCRAMRSAVKHEREHLKNLAKGERSDASIVAHGIQELEHQLSEYEAAAAYAQELGELQSAESLRKILFLKTARHKRFHDLKGNGAVHYESFPVSKARTSRL